MRKGPSGVTSRPPGTADSGVSPATLAAHAAYVLRGNDIGHMTTASPRLYPHQWSWDAAFIATGLAAVSVPRAIAELTGLLRAQWRTGMLPHIVFAGGAEYFPGPAVWAGHTAAAAPRDVATSGICQPPVHAIAVARVLAAGRAAGGADREAAQDFVRRTFDRWLAWHRWLDVRDPDRLGLVEIHHGWESGMDNSPRWDAAYARVRPDRSLLGGTDALRLPGRRSDLAHVKDDAERPTDQEYLRYLWLVRQMRGVRYDDAAVRDAVDFRMADVFVSAVAAVAGEVLAEVGEDLGRADDAAELREQAARFRTGVLGSVSPRTGLARDHDRRRGTWVDTETVAGFAPLLCGGDTALLARQVDLLFGERWCAHPGLRFALPPSTAPGSADFDPRRYWRGPQWPVLSWLLAWALDRHGYPGRAAELREATLRQLADLSFGEYYEPFTGESLGSAHQSWTAAVALDWLAGRAGRAGSATVRVPRQAGRPPRGATVR